MAVGTSLGRIAAPVFNMFYKAGRVAASDQWHVICTVIPATRRSWAWVRRDRIPTHMRDNALAGNG